MTPYSLLKSFIPVAKNMEDFSTRQLVVLLNLHRVKGQVDYKECVRDVQLSKPAVTNACHALVTLGFVRRTKDLDDRRRVWLEITTEGRGFVNKLCGMIPGKDAA